MFGFAICHLLIGMPLQIEHMNKIGIVLLGLFEIFVQIPAVPEIIE